MAYWGKERNQFLEDRIREGNLAFAHWVKIAHPWRLGIFQRLTKANQAELLKSGPLPWLLKKDEPSTLGNFNRGLVKQVNPVAQAKKYAGIAKDVSKGRFGAALTSAVKPGDHEMALWRTKAGQVVAKKVVPVAGAVAGTVLGGPIGTAIGGAAGKLASNVLQDKQLTGKDLMGAALQSAKAAAPAAGSIASEQLGQGFGAAVKTAASQARAGAGPAAFRAATNTARSFAPKATTTMAKIIPRLAAPAVIPKTTAAKLANKPAISGGARQIVLARKGVRTMFTAAEKAVTARTLKQLKLLPPPRGKSVVSARAQLSDRARRWVASVASKRRDAGELLDGGKVYVVEATDKRGLWGITEKLLGPGTGARYKEMLRDPGNAKYPKTADGLNFKNVYVGMRLAVPAAWIPLLKISPAPAPAVVVAPAPAPSPVPAPAPVAAPVAVVVAPAPAPAPAPPIKTGPISPLPSADMVAEAKAILCAWAVTDGRLAVAPADYGAQASDRGAGWNLREQSALLTFTTWLAKSTMGTTPIRSELDAPTYALLVTWANAHIAAQDEVAAEINRQRGQTPAAPAPSPVPAPIAAAPVLVSTKPIASAVPAPTPAPVQGSKAQIFEQLKTALATEKNPTTLRSLANQARMQARGGASVYTPAEAVELENLANQLEAKARSLEATPKKADDNLAAGVALALAIAAMMV